MGSWRRSFWRMKKKPGGTGLIIHIYLYRFMHIIMFKKASQVWSWSIVLSNSWKIFRKSVEIYRYYHHFCTPSWHWMQQVNKVGMYGTTTFPPRKYYMSEYNIHLAFLQCFVSSEAWSCESTKGHWGRRECYNYMKIWPKKLRSDSLSLWFSQSIFLANYQQ